MPNYVQVGQGVVKLRQRVLKISDSNSLSAKKTGPYEECRAALPKRGEFFDEANADPLIAPMRCTEAVLTMGDGGTGEITTTYESSEVEDGVTLEPIGAPVYELEWSEMRNRIERHPRCGILTTSAASIGKSWENWQALEYADYETDPRGDGEFTLTGESIWTLDEFKAMKKRGEEEYVVWTPRVRRTLRYVARPPDVGFYCGRRQNPPDGSYSGVIGEGGIIIAIGAFFGYEWLGASDRLLKCGNKYERTTEWWGASKWDPLLYIE